MNDPRTPNFKVPDDATIDARARAIVAEAELKSAQARVKAEEREHWRKKAKEISRDARKAEDAFRIAQSEFRLADAEMHRLTREQLGLHATLAELKKSMHRFPTEEEEKEFEKQSDEIMTKVADLSLMILAAQGLRGQAYARQIEEGARLAQLGFALENARAKARGQERAGWEGGVSFV